MCVRVLLGGKGFEKVFQGAALSPGSLRRGSPSICHRRRKHATQSGLAEKGTKREKGLGQEHYSVALSLF